MKFDLSSFAGMNIISAKLRLRVSNDSSNSTQTVKSVADTSWSESTLTYQNRPVLGNSIQTFTSPYANTWIEIDLTAQVAAHRGQLMSIGIDETSSNSMNIYTKEASNYRPVLVITRGTQ
jgi:hypothetical protein